MSTLTDPRLIELYSEKVLLKSLKLEIAGMKRRGRSAYAIIKERYGLKGSRQKVYDQLDQLLRQKENEYGLSNQD